MPNSEKISQPDIQVLQIAYRCYSYLKRNGPTQTNEDIAREVKRTLPYSVTAAKVKQALVGLESYAEITLFKFIPGKGTELVDNEKTDRFFQGIREVCELFDLRVVRKFDAVRMRVDGPLTACNSIFPEILHDAPEPAASAHFDFVPGEPVELSDRIWHGECDLALAYGPTHRSKQEANSAVGNKDTVRRNFQLQLAFLCPRCHPLANPENQEIEEQKERLSNETLVMVKERNYPTPGYPLVLETENEFGEAEITECPAKRVVYVPTHLSAYSMVAEQGCIAVALPHFLTPYYQDRIDVVYPQSGFDFDYVNMQLLRSVKAYETAPEVKQQVIEHVENLLVERFDRFAKSNNGRLIYKSMQSLERSCYYITYDDEDRPVWARGYLTCFSRSQEPGNFDKFGGEYRLGRGKGIPQKPYEVVGHLRHSDVGNHHLTFRAFRYPKREPAAADVFSFHSVFSCKGEFTDSGTIAGLWNGCQGFTNKKRFRPAAGLMVITDSEKTMTLEELQAKTKQVKEQIKNKYDNTDYIRLGMEADATLNFTG